MSPSEQAGEPDPCRPPEMEPPDVAARITGISERHSWKAPDIDAWTPEGLHRLLEAIRAQDPDTTFPRRRPDCGHRAYPEQPPSDQESDS